MSARINLIGQGYTSTKSPDGLIHIDRAMPGILHQHLDQTEWVQFCDKVDAVLTELGPIKKQTSRALMIVGILSFVIFGAIAGLFGSGVLLNGRNFFVFPIIAILFTFAPMFLYFRMVKPIMDRVRNALSDLEMVCSEESSKHSHLSFHVREDRVYTGRSVVATNYIEVSMGSIPPNGIGSEVVGTSTFPSAPVVSTSSSGPFSLFSQMAAGAGVSSGGRDPAERLKDLEGIRSLISEEEYNQKKAEILSGI